MTRLRPNAPCWCGSGRKYKLCHMPKERLAGREMAVPSASGRRVIKGTVSPRLSVPSHIVAPDYAITGRPSGDKGRNIIKSPEQIARMRRACRITRRVLDEISAAVRPGLTTDALDRLAHERIIALGGYPSTLNYFDYPKSICTSVNEVICHGIPDDRPLHEGDIVNLDVSVFIDGVHGDCSQTVCVAAVDPTWSRLVEVTRQSLYAGIAAVRPGVLVRDIGRAIQAVAHRHDYAVVRAFVGHGIGELFHMDPQVPHYADHGARFELRPGMTFTIEPMINLGQWRHETWDDNWTAVTVDGLPSAQFEHTVLVTEGGVEVLTLAEGEQQPWPH